MRIVFIALTTVAGAVAAVAQLLDYLATGKINLLLIAIVIIFSAIPIVAMVAILVRGGAGLSFSWNTFRAVAAISATVATFALGTTTVIAIISAASSANTAPPVPPTPTTIATPPVSPPIALPPPTNCPPAGQPEAKAATVIRLAEASYPLAAGPAYYKAKLAGKIQLEIGGQLLGGIPAGKQLFLLGWGDPTTNDSTPKHNPGNGMYYRSNIFRVTGSCYIRPQHEIAYAGAYGITFRQLLVLVDADQIDSFTAPKYNDGYDDAALDSLGVIRLAYFDVPTNDLQ